MSSSALAVTSRALLLGDASVIGRLATIIALAPGPFRRSARLLVIPRECVEGVEVTAEAIQITTMHGEVILPAASGPNRYDQMEQALLRLTSAAGITRHNSSSRSAMSTMPAAPKVQPSGKSPGDPKQRVLWEDRHLTDGRILIERPRTTVAEDGITGWLLSAGRAWRLLSRRTQWCLALAVIFLLQRLAEPSGLIFAVVLVGFLLWTDPAAASNRWIRRRSLEAELAASDSVEARVAGAACRAWRETGDEPSWRSPALAMTRATFDGDREVDAIVDLALRIHSTRRDLGASPTGPAHEVWRQQVSALNEAASRLGERADALIRHRDQAVALTAELAQLAELERLERSALVVDDLTLEISASGLTQRHVPVAEQITAARQAVGELVELMMHTRAPLAEPLRLRQ
jgi:hypothetical protein